MCGICVSVAQLNSSNPRSCHHFKQKEQEHLRNFLKRRGPDSLNEVTREFKKKFNLYFCSAVLHLRGSDITVQPVTDKKENILMWNGEIFGGPLLKADIDEINNTSDTSILAEKMFNAETNKDILDILVSIKGPYAFVFYQADGHLWFGRDIFGRRSLLWNFEDSLFQLCSLAVNSKEAKWTEIPTSGIFCLDLNLSTTQEIFVIHHYPWSSTASGNTSKIDLEISPARTLFKIMPASEITVPVPITEPLNKSIPSDSLFSNVLSLVTDLQDNLQLSKPEMFQRLLEVPTLRETVNNFEAVLSDAVEKRVQKMLNVCKNCYKKMHEGDSVQFCNHSYIGVLFSGGLDSIVIACLADKHIDPRCSIDLLNVAFASRKNIEKQRNGSFDTPDRITGKVGSQSLKDISPSRKWNFVEVNVDDAELHTQRGEHISELLYPSCTVLDDSIGCALWFASKGTGVLLDSDDSTVYNSPSRVLLVGMGADEQLAGYSRHRAKFKNAGWPGLIEEITMELDRIGSRNLGRDDRIIADNGVESRYPFLDEEVVSFLNSLPICLKANLNFERGIGEKLLLRLLAFKLGLTDAAVLPKRAIQFGSRIAKLENSKEKGSDVCSRLFSLS